MTDDLSKQIASAVLDEIQHRPDTPTVDELALIVGSILSCQPKPQVVHKKYRQLAEEMLAGREGRTLLGPVACPPNHSTQQLYDVRDPDESDWATRLFAGFDPNTQEPEDG
jgi:hypothetical protein